MPLSYAAILGGMTTLIGSSTNLLVANSLYSIAEIKIGFFDFFVPGIVIASAGMIYILLFSKFLLKRRSAMANELVTDSDKKLDEFKKYMTIPIINGLSPSSHPAQVLSDIFTIEEIKKKPI